MYANVDYHILYLKLIKESVSIIPQLKKNLAVLLVCKMSEFLLLPPWAPSLSGLFAHCFWNFPALSGVVPFPLASPSSPSISPSFPMTQLPGHLPQTPSPNPPTLAVAAPAPCRSSHTAPSLHVCWGCQIGRLIRVLRDPGRKKKRFLRSPSGHLDSINPDWGSRVCISKHRLRQILMRGFPGHTYKKLHVIGIISFRLHWLPTCPLRSRALRKKKNLLSPPWCWCSAQVLGYNRRFVDVVTDLCGHSVCNCF